MQLLTLSGCTNKDSSSKSSTPVQEITFNIQAEPSCLDSRKARLLSQFNLIRTFNEGLYRTDKDGLTKEALAESVTLLDDKKTYVIELKNSQWSNGEPVVASDFVYAWKSALDKNFPSPCASLLFPLKNARVIKEGLMPTSMLGVHTKGDYTLVIELEEATPFFHELLALPVFFPINQSIAEKDEHWHLNPETYVCNGPFKLQSWKHEDEIVAIRNKRYWDKKSVKLEKIKMIMVDEDTGFKMYQNGETNWAGSPYSTIPLDSIRHLEGSNLLHKDPFLGTYWIRTNVEAFPLQNEDIRKSLAVAINRKEIVEHVLSNSVDVATGIVPECMGLQKAPYFEDGNIQEAKALYDKAIDSLSLSNKKAPSFKLTYVAAERNHKIAAAIQDQLRKALGVDVQLEPLETKVFLDKITRGDYQLACGSWIADYKDPINFLEVFKTKSVGTNNTNWENLDYISAIESSYKCESNEERQIVLQDAEKLLVEHMPAIPVFHYNLLHVQDNKLKDVILSETGSIDFKCAYVSE